MIIVTNNPKVNAELEGYSIDFIVGEYLDVLEKVKKLIIEEKMLLLSHPLSGSIKPNETYYKSVMLERGKLDQVDLESLEYLESAIEVYDKFIKNERRPNWTQEILDDFAMVDFFLIKGATESVLRKF
jgi:hypothetical protein